jgi:SET and MYND domain-containing protein
VCTLPAPLLPFISASLLHDIKTRETHNSFGIRSLDDQGSEFFGYGVWPSASYFNHSCAQNLRRTRRGRIWVFSAGRDIAAGEQLYISYVTSEDSGGHTLGWRERSANLKKTWGFDCACERCGGEKAADGV